MEANSTPECKRSNQIADDRSQCCNPEKAKVEMVRKKPIVVCAD